MIDVGVVTLTEYDDEGFIGLGLDHFGEEKAGTQPIEAHHPYGFIGRPKDPDGDSAHPTLGVTAMYWWQGDTGHAMALGDPRGNDSLPRLQKGETCWYGP